MRRAGKIDLIQGETVKRLRDIGASVQILSGVGHGVPDLLVGYHGVNSLLEVKTGNAPLTADERAWHLTWGGEVSVVRTVEEAQLAVIGRIPRHK